MDPDFNFLDVAEFDGGWEFVELVGGTTTASVDHLLPVWIVDDIQQEPPTEQGAQ